MSDAAPRTARATNWRSSPREILFRVVPAFDSLRNYSRSDLASDAMAGFTVAAIAVPQAMAYAQTAGVPLQYGLYTAIVMTAVGALLDSSKQLINGPTNAISIAILSALIGFSGPERISAVILLALMVGDHPNGHLAAAARRSYSLRFARRHRRLHAWRRGAAGARSA